VDSTNSPLLIVIINEGDRIPADGDVLEAQQLTTDESLLTGESVHVSKFAEEYSAAKNVYAETSVVSGGGLFRFTAIGARTKLGKIGHSLKISKEEPNLLRRETRVLVKRLS